MKASTVFATLAFAFTAVTTHAAECTSDSLASFGGEATVEKLQTACGPLMSTAATVNEANVQDMKKKVCEDKTCLNELQAVLKSLPDCTVQGASMKKSFEDQFSSIERECKKVTSSASASTAAMGVSATAVAAALVVFAQL
jgi:hypothetical protein